VTPLPTRHLGPLAVPAIGYGAMELGGAYASASDVDHAKHALSAAVDAGCTFVDTSDAYGPNERQIAAFLAGGRRSDIQVSTKFGLHPLPGADVHRLPVPYGGGEFAINAEPRHVRAYRAQAVLPIAAVQVQWSAWHPIDPALLVHCETTGVGVVAYAPVGRGFLTGTLTSLDPDTDFRGTIERFTDANLAANHARFAPVRALAAELGLTPARLALAWLLHRSPIVVPIPGSRTPAHIVENAAAARVVWDAATKARVDAAVAEFVPVGATA
jgi:aryl-alcohol dehydrogenase-like predicted oxidoreductase